jgi:hypothetical protein
MSEFSRWPEKSPGSAFEKWAAFCTMLGVVCVLGAHGMDKLVQNGSLPVISFNRAAPNPGVDYSGTASIPHRAQSTSLNPCGSK